MERGEQRAVQRDRPRERAGAVAWRVAGRRSAGRRRPRRGRGAAACKAIRVSLLLFLTVTLLAGGCRRRAQAPGEPRPRDAGALVRAMALQARPERLEGRGSVRMALHDEGLPALDLRFLVTSRKGGQLVLRPGMLPPVLGFWVDPQGWSLRLSRQRLACESGEERGGLVSGPLILRLGWYLLQPQSLLTELDHPRQIDRGEAWVLRGRLQELSSELGAAEIWIDPTTQAVSRWGLDGPGGETLLRVAYDPPLGGDEYRGLIRIVFPGLGLQAQVGLESIRPTQRDLTAPPAVPVGWERLSPEELSDLLAGFAERQRGREAGQDSRAAH